MIRGAIPRRVLYQLYLDIPTLVPTSDLPRSGPNAVPRCTCMEEELSSYICDYLIRPDLIELL